ncbi:Pkinase-domain-containing protein [Neoconidiobolus thromboides FSU 785]|nr:Pkinase-domain-containing protein [Neoconidiobolus thromboides FSU 785]
MNDNIEETYRYGTKGEIGSDRRGNRINPMNINFTTRINNTSKNQDNIVTTHTTNLNQGFKQEYKNKLYIPPLSAGKKEKKSELGSVINNNNHRLNTNPYFTSPSPHNNMRFNQYHTNEGQRNKEGLRLGREIPKIVSVDSLRQQFKLDEDENNEKFLKGILNWSTGSVKKWLEDHNLREYCELFLDNDINGEVLLELTNTLLKQMGVKTVGERVKILHSIKKLKHDTLSQFKESAFSQDNNTHSIPEMSNRLSRAKKLTPDLTLRPQRSAGNLRIVESKNGPHSAKSFFNSTPPNPSPLSLSAQAAYFPPQIHNQIAASTQSPLSNYSLTTPSPRDHETNIMNLDNVQKYCVRVVGDGGQVLVVNLKNALGDAKSIMNRVLAKFSLQDSADNYAIFVASGATAKLLNDDELMQICNSPSHPDKDKFILRKRYSPKSHLELQQERVKRLAEQNKEHTDRGLLAGVEVGAVNNFNEKSNRHSKLFAHRPPSQQITSNLAQYFPIQNLNRHLIKKQQKGKKEEEFKVNKPLKSSKSTKRNNIHKLGIDNLPNYANLSPIHETFSDSEMEGNYVLDPSPIQSPTNNQPSIAAVLSNDDIKIITDNEDLKSKSDSQALSSFTLSPSLENQLLSPQTTESNNLSEEEKNVSATSEIEEEEGEEETKVEVKLNDEIIIDDFDGAKKAKARISMDMEGWIQGAMIGAGSFGSVYLGLNPSTKLVMAVKQVELPTTTSKTENRQKVDQVSSLKKEIGLMRELCHPNIVQYLGSISTETHLNIFLEYVPGGSVAARLAEKGKFTELRTRYYVKQILNGLEYLHSNNIIHRDIKGGNILVDDQDNVKIADFGVSKKVQDSVMSVITPQRTSLQGSVYWMAPEVVKQTHYTRKADIWSLGCLVIEMLSGNHPFPNSTQVEAIFKIGSYSAPDLPQGISEVAAEFLAASLQPKHENRPSSSALISHPFVTDVPVPPSTPKLDKPDFANFELAMENGE